MEKIQFQFKIDGLTPETLPMNRLAQYMTELAILFGHGERVHFDKVRKGSAILQAWAEPQVAPTVMDRLKLADSPDAPEDVKRTFRTINRMLRENDSTGVLKRGPGAGAAVLKFPGKRMPTIQTFRVVEASTLDGVVIRIGGIDDTVPVWIQDRSGTVHKNCHTRNRETAKALAKHYLGSTVRMSGPGKWSRTQEEVWELEEFTIDAFEPINESTLKKAIGAVRGVKDNAWNDVADPAAELKRIRG